MNRTLAAPRNLSLLASAFAVSPLVFLEELRIASGLDSGSCSAGDITSTVAIGGGWSLFSDAVSVSGAVGDVSCGRSGGFVDREDNDDWVGCDGRDGTEYTSLYTTEDGSLRPVGGSGAKMYMRCSLSSSW